MDDENVYDWMRIITTCEKVFDRNEVMFLRKKTISCLCERNTEVPFWRKNRAMFCFGWTPFFTLFLFSSNHNYHARILRKRSKQIYFSQALWQDVIKIWLPEAILLLADFVCWNVIYVCMAESKKEKKYLEIEIAQ